MNRLLSPAPSQTSRPWVTFLAHTLFLLAAWSLFIKYVLPLAFAVVRDEPLGSYVYWDLWPLAHIWLGWILLRQPPYTRLAATVIAAVEIVIIVTLFALFLAEPEWTIWRSNWFVNKVFVLGCFVMLLITVLRRPHWFAHFGGLAQREA